MSDFEDHRQFLIGVAYRMLGSFAEAEDIVQDAFLRWRDVDVSTVEHPRAYLAQVVSRLCLDRMKSATARREQYVGTWLPEPIVASPAAPVAEKLALADDVSVALLLTLERLSPLERAAFVLHDVFDMDYAQIAETLDRSEAAVRQLAARGRDHVRDERPRFETTPEMRTRLTDAFFAAMKSGDVAGLANVLAEDAVFYGDGGGKRLSALNPVYGRERILRFLEGALRKGKLFTEGEIELALINGLPGFVRRTAEGVETLSIEMSGDKIVAIYGMRNPDKMRHLS